MNAAWGVEAAVGLTTALVAVLLQRLVPYRMSDADGPPLTSEERRVYAWWNAAALIPFLVWAGLTGWWWFLMLRDTAQICVSPDPATRFLIRPGVEYWGLLAIFLGIISSALPTAISLRWLLGERYVRFIRASNEQAGYDTLRVFRGLAILIGIASIAAFVIGARTFTRFDDTEIIIARPLAIGSERHNYTQVQTINHHWTFVAPSGATIRKMYYIIHFGDGTSWSTRGGLRDPNPAQDDPIVRFVAVRSGRPIQERP